MTLSGLFLELYLLHRTRCFVFRQLLLTLENGILNHNWFTYFLNAYGRLFGAPALSRGKNHKELYMKDEFSRVLCFSLKCVKFINPIKYFVSVFQPAHCSNNFKPTLTNKVGNMFKLRQHTHLYILCRLCRPSNGLYGVSCYFICFFRFWKKFVMVIDCLLLLDVQELFMK